MKEVAEEVSLSVNGQYKVPPGFRFHPTEEELLHYYLSKKVACEKIDLDVIHDVDLNKLEPWDIQEKCKLGTGPQNDWYFFSHKDKKYPTGTRTNRATAAGFWKATGRDKVIHGNLRRIGMRKTLVFYRGRAPHGQKSDWIMHEYRLEDPSHGCFIEANTISGGDITSEEGWVVCRVFKKKNYVKSTESFKGSSTTLEGKLQQLTGSSNDLQNLEEMLNYAGHGSRGEEEENLNCCDKEMGRFIHLPPIGLTFYQEIRSPPMSSCGFQSVEEFFGETYPVTVNETTDVNHWSALDQLVASQLNGEVETKKELSCFVDSGGSGLSFCISPDHNAIPLNKQEMISEAYSSECDLWNFNGSSPSSSSDPLSHLSV